MSFPNSCFYLKSCILIIKKRASNNKWIIIPYFFDKLKKINFFTSNVKKYDANSDNSNEVI